MARVAPLRQLFSRFMAIGVRNEHVRAVPDGCLAPAGDQPATQSPTRLEAQVR